MPNKIKQNNIKDNNIRLDNNLYAAIDLGSNSFHLIIIRQTGQQMQIIDRHKEMVRLRGGLDKYGFLTKNAFNTGIECLRKFGQLLKNIPCYQVRAVGTNTLRNAKNSRLFLDQAQKILGHNIDIITGEEEARLIFLGVSHGLPNTKELRLIIDIGGGSTEFIIGKDFKHKHLTSTEMGCVSITQKFFTGNKVSSNNMTKAINYCSGVLRPHSFKLINKGWQEAIGSSGSIKAIDEVLQASEFTNGEITLTTMLSIKQQLISAGSVEKANLNGLKEERIPVFIGGLVILIAAFQMLKINKMLVSTNALREGLIYDNLGRLNQKDVRETSINTLQNWLKVDEQQVENITYTAKNLLNNFQKTEKLNSKHLPLSKLLLWAIKLHEGGMALSYKRYRYHSAYLIENAELAGFSQLEQQALSLMVLNHQGKFNKNSFDSFATEQKTRLIKLTLLLRLAILLHRGRKNNPINLLLKVKNNEFTLFFEDIWVEEHPLTCQDLELEAKQFALLDFKLSFQRSL